MIKAQEAKIIQQKSKDNATALITSTLYEHKDEFNKIIIRAAETGRVYAYLPLDIKYNIILYAESIKTICAFFSSYGYTVEHIAKSDGKFTSILINWKEREEKENE